MWPALIGLMAQAGPQIADKFGLGGGDNFFDKLPGHLASGKLLFGTGGVFGPKGLPKGVMSGQDARKMLQSGYSIDDVLMKGPVGTYHPGKSMRQFEKMGVDPLDAYRLLASGGVGINKLAKKFPQLAAEFQKSGGQNGGFGIGQDGGMGPMDFDPFMAMMPAIMGNQSMFSNPNASSWLQSVFGGQLGFPGGHVPFPGQPSPFPEGPVSPGRPFPFPGGQPFPLPFGSGGGFSRGDKGMGPPQIGAPWLRGSMGPAPSKPGPSPSPFARLDGLAGPFGNGGGPLTPFYHTR